MSTKEPDHSTMGHFIRALDLGHAKGPVSIEEARELLAANDGPDPVCMTQEQRHRVLTTLIALLEGRAR